MVGRVTPVHAEIVWTDGVQRTARPTARFNLSMLNELRAVQLSQLAPDLLLAFGYFFGDIDLNNDIEIAALTSARARFALTAQTDSLSFMNAARDLNLIILHFIRASTAQRDCSGRSVQRFFKCDHDVGFDIGAALRRRLTSAKSAESRAAAATAEESFEKVTESSSVELELNSTAVAAPLIKSAAGLLSLPLPVRRRLKTARTIPIRAELVVFLALLGA